MNLPARRPEELASRTTSYRHVGVTPDTHWREMHDPSLAPPRELDPVFAISVGNAREMLTFPLRAVRRHRSAASLVFFGTIAITALAAFFIPRHYIVQTRILAQPNFVMPALNNPRRSIPSESDAPSRLAGEAVMKQDNLLEIIRETNLMSTWVISRTPLGKIEDFIRARMARELSEKERTERMVGLLRKRLWVDANEGTVTIGVDWTDPRTAFRIAETAQQNFFDQRHASDVAMISESIAILEGHVAEAQTAIQDEVAEINRMGGFARRSVPITITAPQAPRVSPNASEIASLQSAFMARRQTISDLESARAQRISTLQASLSELRNSYGPAHPQVVSTTASIRALSTDSPQLAALRSQEDSLAQRLISLGARPGDVAQPSVAEPQMNRAALQSLVLPRSDSLEDPQVTYAKSRLKMATGDYEDMLQRLEAARIELQTARAAFKYKYAVVTPPQLPTQASKPRIPLLVAGGCFLAVVLVLFTAVVLDLGSGQLLENWQVTRSLHLPIIAHAPVG